jgi:endonuclease/exonuclease/phosphatase (EEP) superfamily protein YafD
MRLTPRRLSEPDDEMDDGADPYDEMGAVEPSTRWSWLAWLRPSMPVVIWASTIGFFLYAFVRVFGLERTWLGYTAIAFTPYVAAASILPPLVAAVTRRKRAAILGLITSFALGSVLLPRAVGHPDPVRGPVVHVMSLNMKFGGADPATVMKLAQQHRVDVLALQEYTPQADNSLSQQGLSTLLPYSIREPRPTAAGSAIYSRFPLSDTGFIVGSNYFLQAYATVHVPGAQPILMRSVHPVAPATPGTTGGWRATLLAEPDATPHGPVQMLVGDFNASLDHALLRRLIDTGYRDAASRLGDGLVTTWPYDGTLLPRVTLDHLLADPRIGISAFQATTVDGSDHRAIFVTITVPRG